MHVVGGIGVHGNLLNRRCQGCDISFCFVIAIGGRMMYG